MDARQKLEDVFLIVLAVLTVFMVWLFVCTILDEWFLRCYYLGYADACERQEPAPEGADDPTGT